MANVTYELLIILMLLVANGFLALSEIAVVSARRPRLLQRAERGDLSAAAAADLSQSPTRFLSTVQVGITLIGILSGAYGGATIAEALAAWLEQYPNLMAYREQIAVGIVVVVVLSVGDHRRAGAKAHRAEQSGAVRVTDRATDAGALTDRHPGGRRLGTLVEPHHEDLPTAAGFRFGRD
jgi:Mg2+/Co2+ transporter CorB